MPTNPRLRIRLLGGFSVSIGESEVPERAFRRRKPRSLLKLLALQPGHVLHRDQVMDLLWPGLEPSASAAQLYKAIHYVRDALAGAEPGLAAESLVRFRDEVVGLSAPGGVETDVEAFQGLARQARSAGDVDTMERAVAGYTGDLLPADLYEDWAAGPREALQQRYMELLLDLGAARLELGHLGEAADAYRHALRRDPVAEAAHRGLMRVFAQQGNRTRALRQFQHCTEALQREMGVGPDSETTRLHQEIVKGEVGARKPVRSPSGFEPGPLAQHLGREAETRTILALLAGLESGKGAVLGVEGAAGIGKTRLAQQILQLGREHGYRAFFGGTHQQEGRSAYAPFVEALRMALQRDPAHSALIPAELAVSIPEIPPGTPAVRNTDRKAAQAELFAGVLRFLSAEASAAPVIFILDDLQIADEGSLRLFHYLARQTPRLPLLLVGTWREPDLARELASLTGSLDRQGLVQRLVLSPLSKSETRDVLAQALGRGRVEPRLAGEIYRLCGGNPLLAREMIGHLATVGQIAMKKGTWRRTAMGDLPIPPSLQAFMSERLAGLSEAALALVQLAAVAGYEIALPVLEQGAGAMRSRPGNAPALLDSLDEALRARLLQEHGLSYRFVHALFREAIYQRMSQARRRALHGVVARTLEAVYAGDPQIPIEAIASHYLRASDVSRAARYLVQAGDRAESVYDHAGAIRRYREALSLLTAPLSAKLQRTRADVLERVGDVNRLIGDLPRSLEAYREALESIAGAPADPIGPGVLCRKVALAAILTTDMPVAAEHLARARRMVEAGSLEESRLLIAEALYDWHRNALKDAVKHALRALAVAEAAGARLEVSQACEMLALTYLPLGEWEKGMKYELRREVAGWSPEVAVAVDAHMCLWEYHLDGEDPYRQAREFIGEVAKQAAALGDLRCVAVCHYALGSMAFLRGDMQPAAEQLERALALNRRIGSRAGAAYTLARQASLLTTQGDQASGWALVLQGLEAAGEAAVRDHALQRLYGAGIRNRLAAGDMAGAAALVRAAERPETQATTCTVCSVHLYPAVASFYVASGDIAAAEAYAEKALRLAEAGHNQGGEAEALRVHAEVRAARGDLAGAEAFLERASAIFGKLRQVHDLEAALKAWGELPLASRDRLQTVRREAQDLLQRLPGDTHGRG